MLFSAASQSNCVTAAPAGFMVVWSPLTFTVPLHKFPLFQGRKFNKVLVANTLCLLFNITVWSAIYVFMQKYSAVFGRWATLGKRKQLVWFYFIYFKMWMYQIWKPNANKIFIFVYILTICVVYFFFFLDWLCLQGDVSVPNRWPSFYTRTIFLTLKGPFIYITCLWIQ